MFHPRDLSHQKVAIDICDYLIDSDFPLRHKGDDSQAHSLEPRYVLMSDEWSKVRCREFLDPSHSGLFGRAFWLPIPGIDKSAWGEFCLLGR